MCLGWRLPFTALNSQGHEHPTFVVALHLAHAMAKPLT